MKQGQFRVRLRPCCGGAYTQVRLCGAVPTAVPARTLKRLAATLTFWSGWPVALALPVGHDSAGWCEAWSDGLQDVPERHLEIRFVLPRHRVRSGAGGHREP
jgi:hypothetical protein